LAAVGRGDAGVTGLPLGSLEPAAAQPARVVGGVAGDDLCVSARNGLGAAPGRGGDRLRPLDRLEGAAPRRDLQAGTGAEGTGEPLRVALSRRSVAHGSEPVRVFRASG